MKKGVPKILIAPDSFKGSLSAKQVAKSLALGVRRAAHREGIEISVHVVPFSDGGEGFLETIETALGGQWMDATCRHVDLHLPPRKARWLWHPGRGWAIGESAEVIGLHVTQSSRPGERTAVGIADYLGAMRRHHPDKIILGVGGTSTYEGGVTVAAGLGTQFYHTDEREIVPSGLGDLAGIVKVKEPEPWQTPIECWCDVKTPLIDERGGASRYAAQKGATAHESKKIEKGVLRWIKLLNDGMKRAEYPGTGAGGGLPYGMMTATDVRIKSGAEELMRWVHLERNIEEAEYVLSGEGRIDETSGEGKLLDRIHNICLEKNKSATFFTGNCSHRPTHWDRSVQIISPEGEGSGPEDSSLVSEKWLAHRAELFFYNWIKCGKQGHFR